LIGEYSDEGRSGRTDVLAKRPGFQAAITAVQSQQADAILVHKVDRAARNLRILLETLHQLGGGILAVEGDFDYTTPEGKLRAHIMGGVAQWYSDNLARETRKGLEQRKRSGLWSGRLPLGYCKQNGDNKLPPVPDTKPILEAEDREWSPRDIVLEIFTLTAQGRSSRGIVERIRRIGYGMGRSVVDHVVHNRFYLGELPLDPRDQRNGRWIKGKHEPIVSQQLYDAGQAARRENRKGSNCIRKQAHVYPLSGLVRCGRCQRRMYARRDFSTKERAAWLSCHGRYEGAGCDQPNVKMAPLEQQIEHIIDTFSPLGDLLERAAEQVRETRRDTRSQRSSLMQRKRRLLDLYEWSQISKEEYAIKVAEIERELEALQPQEEPNHLEDLRKFVHDLSALYRAGNDEQRNELLRRIFSEFMVDGYNIVAVRPRQIIDTTLRIGREAAESVDLPNCRASGRR